jgi:hypothetical protein
MSKAVFSSVPSLGVSGGGNSAVLPDTDSRRALKRPFVPVLRARCRLPGRLGNHSLPKQADAAPIDHSNGLKQTKK